MASTDWQEIYRSYTSEELTVERARLKKLIEDRQGMASQTIGQKSWSSDLGELRNQLQACVRVIRERGTPKVAMVGMVDYSNAR